MAQIKIFQGGSVSPDAPSVTPVRAPDFGPGIGPGLESLGKGIGEAAQKLDEIQDINARIEANKHSIAYNNLATTISLRVRSALGENAEAAADKGYADLEKGTSDILSGSSPRARKILEQEFAKRNNDYRGQWYEHGFSEKKSAFDTSSEAANDRDLDAGLKSSSDQAAQPYLDSIKTRNQQRATFFGLGSDWEAAENGKYLSSFYKGRAETLAASSASEAIKYAIAHRDGLSGRDFESIVRAYHDESFDEQAAQLLYGPGGLASSLTRNEPAPADNPTPSGTVRRADPRMVFNGLIVPNEGSKLVTDTGNGHPVKYGFNQKDNPDIDVSKLTHDGAQSRFVSQVWNASGADKLPAALAVVHADTYLLNPKEAGRILKASGGDVQKYLEMRASFLASLHAKDPARWPDYTSRNERVEHYAAMVGGDGTSFSFQGKIGPDTPMQPLIDEVMARKDMPLGLKTAIIRLAREDRNSQREDKTLREGNARDALLDTVTKLADKFTSIKQLPPEQWLNASPETRRSLTELMRTNNYKHNDETLRPTVTFTMVTDPQRFMSKDFIEQLMRKGASPSLIGEVQTQQANIFKKQMNAKPDVISDGTLWGIAKPAFEAAGIVNSDKKAGKQRAQQQEHAVGFLQRLATEWANNNPGQRPTPETMHQWVGTALLQTRSGSRLFEATDVDVYNSLNDNVRTTIIRDLRRGGVTSQGNELIADVANYYRKLRSLYGTGPIALGTRDGSVQARPMRGNDTVGDMIAADDQ